METRSGLRETLDEGRNAWALDGRIQQCVPFASSPPVACVMPRHHFEQPHRRTRQLPNSTIMVLETNKGVISRRAQWEKSDNGSALCFWWQCSSNASSSVRLGVFDLFYVSTCFSSTGLINTSFVTLQQELCTQQVPPIL